MGGDGRQAVTLLQVKDQYLSFQEATPVEHPFSAMKQEQQKKWLLDLDKQKEEAKLRKIEEKHNYSKVAVI